MARIFISYKRKDKDVVFPIMERIEAAIGEKCWIDKKGIESSAQFTNDIMKGIDEAEIVLFMYSKCHSMITDFENDWTIKELIYAQDEHKRIVFITLDDTPLIKKIRFEFPRKEMVDSRDKEAMQRLFSDLRTWLGIAEPEVSMPPSTESIPQVENNRIVTPDEVIADWHNRLRSNNPLLGGNNNNVEPISKISICYIDDWRNHNYFLPIKERIENATNERCKMVVLPVGELMEFERRAFDAATIILFMCSENNYVQLKGDVNWKKRIDYVLKVNKKIAFVKLGKNENFTLTDLLSWNLKYAMIPEYNAYNERELKQLVQRLQKWLK